MALVAKCIAGVLGRYLIVYILGNQIDFGHATSSMQNKVKSRVFNPF